MKKIFFLFFFNCFFLIGFSPDNTNSLIESQKNLKMILWGRMFSELFCHSVKASLNSSELSLFE